MLNAWLQCYSGTRFDLEDPDPSTILIIDIAHSLSNLCRYGGHSDAFYSVAQHSVIVSDIVSPENAFEGLMHDAVEAYVGDMIKPLKALFPEYKFYERRLDAAIRNKFHIPLTPSEEVHEADTRLMYLEAKLLFGDMVELWEKSPYPKLDMDIREFLEPRKARELFLARFNSLSIKEF